MSEKAKTSKILLPTACFPDTLWMAYLVQSSKAFIEIHETYPKQTIRNRFYIATANGPLRLSIPVEKTEGNHTKTKDIKVLYLEEWPVRHFRAIVSAYNKSPYFYHYQPEIEHFFRSRFQHLYDLNEASIHLVLKLLKTKNEIFYTHYWERNPEDTADLRLFFDSMNNPVYKLLPAYYQVFSDRFGFLNNMSILDLIFNLGPRSLDYLMEIKLPSDHCEVLSI